MNMQKACAGVAGKPGYTDCRLKAGSVQYRAKRGPSSLPGRPLPVSGVKYCTTLRMKSVQYCSLRYPMLCTPNLAHVAKRHRGGPAGAWGSSVAWFQEDQGASSALLSYHRLVPVSALAPARHPQPARCHCGQGSPHHHLPSHGRYNVDKPSLPASLVSVVHYRSLGIKPQFPDRPGCDPSQRKYWTAVGKESVQYRSRAMTDYGCSAVVFEPRGRGVGARSLAENGSTEDSVLWLSRNHVPDFDGRRIASASRSHSAAISR